MKGYKAYKKGLICKGFQYEEGKIFKTDKAICCSTGFHFCENPLDTLNYYDLCESEFTEVEALGDIDLQIDSEDTKCATNRIKIGAKLDLKGFINASFHFLWSKCTEKLNNDYSQVATSGDNSQVATSGDRTQVATSGDNSQVATSGYRTKVEINGQYSVGAAIGINSTIKGEKGNWITLAEWVWDDEKETYIPVCVKSAQIDGEILKPNTYYQLVNSEFVEVIE